MRPALPQTIAITLAPRKSAALASRGQLRNVPDPAGLPPAPRLRRNGTEQSESKTVALRPASQSLAASLRSTDASRMETAAPFEGRPPRLEIAHRPLPPPRLDADATQKARHIRRQNGVRPEIRAAEEIPPQFRA